MFLWKNHGSSSLKNSDYMNTSHLTSHPSKMKKICRSLLEKLVWTHKWLWTPTHRYASGGWPARDLYLLCADTGWSLDDLLVAIDD